MKFFLLTLLLTLLFKPSVGILSQELPRTLASISPNRTSYIAASYVKWIEGQGARVVPIRLAWRLVLYHNLQKLILQCIISPRFYLQD